jgi:hypothetical protein
MPSLEVSMSFDLNSAIDTERVFYQAFANCDLLAMKQVWAGGEVICVHPGSQAIVGYEAVMRSWEYIFHDAELPDIQIKLLNRFVSDSLAVHVVEEHISTGNNKSALLLASNVYRHTESGWLMVEHHGSVVYTQAQKHTVQ